MRGDNPKYKPWNVMNAGGYCGWLLMSKPLISFIFSRRRALDEYNSVDSSAMVFILYAVICFFAACYYFHKSKSRFAQDVLLKTPMVFFLIYTLYGMFSMFWSVDVPLTGYRSFECLSMMLVILATLQNLISKDSYRVLVKWSLYYVSFGICLSIIKRMQWATTFQDIMSVSQMDATVFFFMALYYTPKSWYNWLVMVYSIFSFSTVAYIGMAMGSISAFWTKGRGKKLIIIGAVCLAVFVVIYGPRQFLKDTVFFDKNDIALNETSGRDQIMYVALESLYYDPMGLGFFAGEPVVLYEHFTGAIGAHNSIFSAAMGLGIPGMVMMIAFFIAMFYGVFSRYIPQKLKPILIGCYFVAFLQCMGNPSLGTRVYGAWMPCCYICMMVCAVYVNGKDRMAFYYKKRRRQIISHTGLIESNG